MTTRHPKRRSVIHVAAGPRLGYGHLMRARALAQQLGMHVSVSIRGGLAAARTARALGLRVLQTAKGIDGADVLVVDDPSLMHGRGWIARARRAGVPTVSIHDFARVHDADLVVCGSVGINAPRGPKRVLNGPQFYLLDSRIRQALQKRRRSASQSLRVVVALGGGHHVRRIAQQLVDAVRRDGGEIRIDVAAGFSRGRRPVLRGARWLPARTGLSQALANCDVAVVAGGVTLYEACALGAPAVGLAVVPGQRRAVREFAKRGAIVDAGDVSERTIERAAKEVRKLLIDERRRRVTAARARRLVDGLGAERVAEQIRAMLAAGSRRIA